MQQQETNRWKGFILGAVGGIAGVIAMRYYWKAAAAFAGEDPRKKKDEPGAQALDSISLIGTHHRPQESSTAALGRIIYKQIAGREPEKETKTLLSYLIHWLISMLAAGLYGAMRGRATIPDTAGGLLLGMSLWLFGDELLVPLLGLSDGPTAYPLELHAHGLGAHLAYGLASSATAQSMYWLTELD